jgi:uncharacterized BrkB/YihY/UPF0761 family membrane protein
MQVKRFAKQFAKEFVDDNVTDVGAMMAYYAVIALFPMLVFVVSLALLVTPGAFIGVLLWLGLSALFGLYLSHFNSYEATYGTLGGAIIFLTWLWLSNITLLAGAEINDVIADIAAPHDAAAAQLADQAEKGPHVDVRAAQAQVQHAT